MATTNPIAPKTKPGSKPGAKGAPTKGLMGKKIAGLPLPVVLGGVLVAIVAGLYLRSKLGGGSASTAAAPTDATPVDTSGGASSTGDPGTDTSFEDLAAALNGLTGILSSGTTSLSTSDGSSLVDTSSPGTASGSTLGISPSYTSAAATGLPVYVNPNSGSVLVGPDAKGAVNAPGYVNVSAPIPVATSNFAEAAVARSAALSSVGVSSPFGGVTNVTTNKKTGVVTTTYGSGRVVQQAPGKTAYVAKKGS